MAKRKVKEKQGIQAGMFDQETFEPVDRVVEVIEHKTIEIDEVQVPYVSLHLHRPQIEMNNHMQCPICSSKVKFHVDGRIRCTKLECFWWQGLAEVAPL